MDNIHFIGVAGGSGSGKSTVARKVLEAVGPEEVSYIQQDSYYKDLSHLPADVRMQLNFDHPEAFDNQLLLEHLNTIRHRESIEKPIYDFKSFTRVGFERVEPRKVILVEGILVLGYQEIRDMLGIKIFVDTDSDLRIIRRIRRDVLERGRSLEFVLNQYLETVRPMHQQFIEPTKRFADIIIPEGGNNLVAMDMLITKIQALLSS
ncbi:uridine kinase [bacterium (Candidatus Blackallbacteria) CG17_big_fil_post_rev_8_21_14_2_50_48_46]|uniref:Uridine kinase n=1 Tax=bacterium (Candidatus Blackallbacteria) CG17_big_fil_post_rev_8_21_14_2_50_48_46 TaxID=2014261 RepID=A0A2M7G2Q8_9BACT|nr:MAG: uridine kinase [bacterium (Candidatus Blackallbacteria) CG18_big_fil_WC_8_21_14_2_50_49_26]PIW16090.1 MAG: uridine kinase [bacterium (Candidatus Blackallbacteria) CG17_big_fil_post_rev_8_21_14_2_50_48_46]PIW50502.1 MAG: uridine kinase [bacterium (Candidatus Blackallbacteria) CG13_big_fil_rev_8_21_14_2_50_49_14]